MTDDADLPDSTKLTRSKQRWASEGKFLTGAPSRTAGAAPFAPSRLRVFA